MLALVRDWVATAKALLPLVAAVTALVVIAAILVVIIFVLYRMNKGTKSPQGSQEAQQQTNPIADFGHLIVVSLGIMTVLVAFLVTLLFSADLLKQTSEVIALLTAVFGVIGTLVGTYFGIKASTDATQTAQQQAATAQRQVQEIASASSTPLAVVSNSPVKDATGVDPDTIVTVTFSQDMDTSSIIGTDHFTLVRVDDATSGAHTHVNGTVDYGPPTYGPRIAAFQPKEELDNGYTYRATITRGSRDMRGNALAADYTWQFTVKTG